MPDLRIEKVPADLYAKVKALAAERGQTLRGFVIMTLKAAVAKAKRSET